MEIFNESMPFFKCNFHMHTTESDGALTPAQALKLYRDNGYDVVAITDHRKVTHVAESEIPAGLRVYPGIELDYNSFFPNETVHLLGIGVDDEIVKKWNPGSTVQQGINLLNSLCPLTVLCHPAWSLNLPSTIASMKGIDAVEVWNSVSTLPATPPRADSTSLLDVTATHFGWTAPFLAQDDSHWYEGEQFLGCTMVQAPSTDPEDVFGAIKSGHSYATQGPAFYSISIENGVISATSSPVSAIAFATNNQWAPGRVTTGENVTFASFKIPQDATFIRVQLVDKQGKMAWSNQIVLK